MKSFLLFVCFIFIIIIIPQQVQGRHPLPPVLFQEQVTFENEDCTGQVILRRVSLTMNCSIVELQPDVCVHGGMYRCAANYDEVFAMPNYVAMKYTDTISCRENDIWRDVVGFIEGCYIIYMDGVVVGSYRNICDSGSQRQMAFMSSDCSGQIVVDDIFGATDTFDECIPTIHSGKWKKTHCST